MANHIATESAPPPSADTPPPSGGTPPPSGGTPPPSGGTPPPSGGTPPPSGGTPPSGDASCLPRGFDVSGCTHSYGDYPFYPFCLHLYECSPGGIDGGWGVWGPWSACTETCKDGTVVTRERVRVCNSPAPGPGGKPCHGGDGTMEREVVECEDLEPCEITQLLDALYPFTQAYGGEEVDGTWHNQASLVGTTFVPGPTGCAGGAVQLSGNEDSYIIIRNVDYKLSYGPSFSFFVNLLHEKNYCPILEYGPPNHAHPEVYLHFHTYWSNIEGLYFNLGDESVPNPWYGVNNIIEPYVWNHVGFTYSDEFKEFKFWVNGADVSTLDLPEGLGTNTKAQEVKFGLRRGYAALKGKLNCAAFFNHALNAVEVNELRHRCKDLECTMGCLNHTDCHCFKETCYDLGFHYCKDAAKACENQCHEDHCCCCQDDYRLEDEDKCDATTTDPSPCECFADEGVDLTCGERQLRYCDPEDCANVDEGCPGYRCCCPEDAETCPSWAECHCMEFRCEQEEGLMECDAAVCGDGCEHGHCCCCEEDWPVCAPDAACACEAAPCDQLPGRGYCDADRCPLPQDLAARLGGYFCPRQHCCCSMEEV